MHPLSYEGRGIQIGPSRSSSLRRTSSLTDLDVEFAGVVGSIIGSESERAMSRSERRRALSSYYTPAEGEDKSDSQTVLSVSISDGTHSGVGRTRRVAASTYYSLSSFGPDGSASNISSHSRTGENSGVTPRSGVSGSGTPVVQSIVQSTLSLRRTVELSAWGLAFGSDNDAYHANVTD